MALVGALAMLFLFVLLGTAYVKYMGLELQDTRNDLERARVRALAQSGIHAAIGEIQAALSDGKAPEAAYDLSVNVYKYRNVERIAHPQDVHVTVADESARININHATPAVLGALGFGPGAVQRLKVELPKAGSGGKKRWLGSVHDLRTRDILNAQAYEALNTDILTTYTVAKHDNPTGFINVNTATPPVLAALLGIDKAEARALAAKRPFRSWQNLVAKSGREQATFNVSTAQYASRQKPAEIALQSNCFRLRSEATLQYEETARRPISETVEAVVLFKANGSYTIRYWNAKPGEDTGSGAAPVQPPEAPPEPEPIPESTPEQTPVEGSDPEEATTPQA